jgi:hypothetical protein
MVVNEQTAILATMVVQDLIRLPEFEPLMELVLATRDLNYRVRRDILTWERVKDVIREDDTMHPEVRATLNASFQGAGLNFRVVHPITGVVLWRMM